MDIRPYKITPPKGYEKYIVKHYATMTYLIFTPKTGEIYCTRCGKTHRSKQLAGSMKHNVKATCPKCGTTCIAKKSCYGRKGLSEYMRVLWFTSRGKDTYAQLDEIEINYEAGIPEVITNPTAQYKLSKKEQKYYKWRPAGYYQFESWDQGKKVTIPRAPGDFYGQSRFWKDEIYMPSLKKMGEDITSMHLEFSHIKNDYYIIRFLDLLLKRPGIEILEKAGFHQIVESAVWGRGCRYINWKATNLRAVLKLNREEIREFRKTNPSMGHLETYREAKKVLPKIKMRHIPFLGHENSAKRLENMAEVENISPYKILEYISKQQGFLTIADYGDYLTECRKLGYDMKRKQVLFPDDFADAHEKASNKVKVLVDRETKENFAKYQRQIYPYGAWQNGNLLIRAAENPAELNAESRALGHCVRTYAENVARGTCAILFVRKADEPDKAYYTLELSPKGEMVQCRGVGNCSMTNEVKAFVKAWLKWMKSSKKKNKKEAA